jgi:hypothetical protein
VVLTQSVGLPPSWRYPPCGTTNPHALNHTHLQHSEQPPPSLHFPYTPRSLPLRAVAQPPVPCCSGGSGGGGGGGGGAARTGGGPARRTAGGGDSTRERATRGAAAG